MKCPLIWNTGKIQLFWFLAHLSQKCNFTIVVKPWLLCCFDKVISEDYNLFCVISDSFTFPLILRSNLLSELNSGFKMVTLYVQKKQWHVFVLWWKTDQVEHNTSTLLTILYHSPCHNGSYGGFKMKTSTLLL
jgi:hypothetical protein